MEHGITATSDTESSLIGNEYPSANAAIVFQQCEFDILQVVNIHEYNTPQHLIPIVAAIRARLCGGWCMYFLLNESSSKLRGRCHGIPLAALCLLWIVIASPKDTFSQVLNVEVADSRNAEDQSEDPEVSKFSEEDRNWWAFQQPVRHPVPEFDDPRWRGNPVNAFIKEKMDEKGLVPAPGADKRGLIRRAYLDLIGLLPAPEEVEAFVSDESPDAFKDLIDRLLASHHYGARWGRH